MYDNLQPSSAFQPWAYSDGLLIVGRGIGVTAQPLYVLNVNRELSGAEIMTAYLPAHPVSIPLMPY